MKIISIAVGEHAEYEWMEFEIASQYNKQETAVLIVLWGGGIFYGTVKMGCFVRRMQSCGLPDRHAAVLKARWMNIILNFENVVNIDHKFVWEVGELKLLGPSSPLADRLSGTPSLLTSG
jgi:hypothetical protein